jgi:phospholipid/cholesterol/gamma-HCH transport system ATP-binding protein
MYDEPFAGQDPMVKGVLVTLIRTLREALGLTTIVVSHDIPETLQIADYVYILANKNIIGQGTPDELKNSDSPFVQQFLNGTPDGPVRFHYPAPSYAQELGVGS